MEIWNRLKNVNISVFVKLTVIFAFIEILLLLGAKLLPELIPPVMALYLAVLMIILSLVAILIELNLSLFDLYNDFTEETLKYSKSIMAGIAGGLVVSTSTQYDIGEITSLTDAIGEATALLIRVIIILGVLLAGLIGFILVERNHQEVSK
jgi:hypothetical protein